MPPLAPALALLLTAAPLAATAAAPRDAAARLLSARPAARSERAANGGLSHLSGFAEPPLATGREESARRFLARHGAAFGADPASLETVRVGTDARGGGAATFRRLVQGKPVFGGDVTVGWRADGAITLVNGSPRLATEVAGSHRVDPRAAVEAALSASRAEPGDVAGEPGWLEFDGRLVPVVRVAHGGARDAAYTFVDAETGAVLYRASRVRHAAWQERCTTGPCIRSFLASPLAPLPASAGGNAPRDFQLGPLVSPGTRLAGTRTAAFNCAGYDWLASDFPGRCETERIESPGGPRIGGQTALANGLGSFLASPDPTQIDPLDAFAEQSAYFHIDAHARFLEALDPTWGGIGYVPGYVNLRDAGAPLDNAFYSPGGGPPDAVGVMVFGQGTHADLAYDGEIVFHELTHAAVDVTSGMQGVTDLRGVNSDPDSLNEGTADTFAFAHLGEALLAERRPVAGASCMSRYFAASIGLDCLRQARNERTCRGGGPNLGRNPGRTGEVHDDGEIWTGFTWALYEAAAAEGHSLAMAKALFKATRVAGPTPTFEGFAATVRQKIADSALEPDPADRLPAAAVTFADCTIAQRDLAGCADRAVPLYSGERAQGVVFGLLSSPAGTSAAGQQYFIDVPCGATALRVQSGDTAATGTVYVRRGSPVEFGSPALLALPRYDWALRGNHAEAVLDASGCAECLGCGGTRTAFGAGRWYFLATGELGTQFELGVSLVLPAGQAAPARPAATMGTCTWGVSATPTGGSPPVPALPPAITCDAPRPLPVDPTCGGLQTPGGGGSSGGCGCSHLGAGDALVGLAGLLALRWRSRRGRRVHTLEA